MKRAYTIIRAIKRLLHMQVIEYNFGYVPDKKDDRDILYQVKRCGPLPESTCRRNIAAIPWRYNQLSIGSCVAHGMSEAFRHVLKVNKMPDFEPSRLFAYYIARQDKNNDTGASIRDAFKAINQVGLCSEPLWKYIPDMFAVTPSKEAFDEAEKHQVIRYNRVPQDKEAIKEVLNSGYPIVYGMKLYKSFMGDQVSRTGIVPMPRKCWEESLGGHCMMITDYDEKGIIVLNSWGGSWGQGGVCEIPWDYILDPALASDFWVTYLSE